MRVRGILVGAGIVLAPAAPSVAGFNDIVQIVCDVDNVITTGCDLTHDGLQFAAAVAVSPDDDHVYVCSSLEDTLSAYSRAADGTLTLVDQEIEGAGGVTTLSSCRAVAVSPDGKHVYTAALTDNAVTWFSRNAMTGVLTFTGGDSVSGGGSGSSLSGADAVVVSPDNEHVYVAGRSGDAIAAFSRNTTTGDLSSLDDYFDGLGGIDGLETPEALVISPDGKHLYAASEGDGAVAVFARDNQSASGTFGELTFVEVRKDGVGGVDGLETASRLAIDLAGANLYATSRRGSSEGDWIAVFSRNAATGSLTFLESVPSTAVSLSGFCSGVGPTDSGVTVSPSGLFVAVAQPFRAAIVTFSRAADGTLSLVEAICDDLLVDDDELGSIVAFATSADGKSLYAAGGPFSLHSVVDYECGSANTDLVLGSDDVSTVETETACRSIEAGGGTGYDILGAGEVTMTAPTVRFIDDVSIAGELTVVSAVP